MLENLKSINVKGGFFEEEKNIELFNHEQDRISFIYGRNGSGKSSISNVESWVEELKKTNNS